VTLQSLLDEMALVKVRRGDLKYVNDGLVWAGEHYGKTGWMQDAQKVRPQGRSERRPEA
jgi:hypothetical protein